MIAHTPGPWTLEIDTHQAPSGDWYAGAVGVGSPWDGTHRTLARIRQAEHSYDEAEVAEVEANARLIATAPSLLAALEAALEQTFDGLHQSRCDVPGCWVEAAEQAIAKAKGGAS